MNSAVQKLTYSSVAVLCILILPACDFFSKKSEPVAKTEGLVVVNVLDKEFYDDCHIKGSINVLYTELKNYAESHWDKEKTEIVLYCSNHMCTASKIGAEELQQLGFKHVFAYEGGTAEWKQKGYPLVGECTQKYLTMKTEPTEDAAHNPLIITAEELHKKIDENAANIR